MRLSAEIVERDTLRHTPAGVPVVEFRLKHRSDIVEAGHARSIEFEMRAIAVGEPSRWIAAAPLSAALTFEGFLAKRSLNSKTLVFHVTGLQLPDAESITKHR